MNRIFNTGTIVVDDTGVVKSSNHFVSHITERNPNSIIGMKLSSIFIENKESLIKEDGNLVNVVFEKNPIFIGRKEYFLYVFWDIKFEVEKHPIFNSITKHSFDTVLVVNNTEESNILYASPAIEGLGCETRKAEVSRLFDFVEKDFVYTIKTAITEVNEFKSPVIKEFKWVGNDGKKIPIQTVISPVFSKKGDVTLYSFILKRLDIDEVSFKESVKEKQYLSSLFTNNPDMAFSLDENFCLNQVNSAVLEETKFSLEDLAGKPLTTMFHIKQFQEITKLLLDVKKEGIGSGKILRNQKNKKIELEGFNLNNDEFIIYGKYSEPMVAKLTFLPILLGEEVVGIYGIAKNINDIKIIEKQITNLAYYDELTKIPNRSSFQIRMSNKKFKDSIETGTNDYDKFALMFFDLDNFKGINDNLGHKQGDELLESVAMRIKKVLPKNCFFSRISGDEFTVMVEDFNNEKELEDIAIKIKRSFIEPFALSGEVTAMSCSIGIAIHPKDATNASDLQKYADIAMYNAKSSGKNFYSFFDQDMLAKPDEEFNSVSNVRNALLENQFVLYYQPIIKGTNEKVRAFEALIRWEHPEKGIISPGLFIPQAEKTGAIQLIGEFVIEEACRQIKDWEDKNTKVVPVSINISTKQLERKAFYKSVQRIVFKHGINPSNLIIEVTESVSIKDDDIVSENLDNIKKIGCSVAIDDFGAGHSSLTYLKDFSVDYLKMDRSFIKDITKDSKLKHIVKTIIDLGHILQLEVIAEGVEDQDGAELLKLLGADHLQGYYYCKPSKKSDVEREYLDVDKG